MAWYLTAVFDDPFAEGSRAREFWQENGRTEMREFIVYLTERWSLKEEEDFHAALDISDARQTITATDEMADSFFGITDWLIGHTSPVRVTLVRGPGQ